MSEFYSPEGIEYPDDSSPARPDAQPAKYEKDKIDKPKPGHYIGASAHKLSDDLVTGDFPEDTPQSSDYDPRANDHDTDSDEPHPNR